MASILKRSGGYQVRYRDPLGKQRARQFKRKVDAERFAREVEVDMHRGAWIDPKGADVPLAVWVESFMAMCVTRSPTTIETYRRDLDNYVLPAFGARRLGQLRAEEIERWLNDEIVAGIASSSVHRRYRTLRRVLQAAVEKERLLTNPCNRVQPPKVTTRKMTVLDWTECLAVAEAMSPRYRAMIYLALDSGMRWSELVGLRRSQVDIDRRKVRVTEQLVELADRSRIRKEPKTTAGVRSITISALTAEMLGEHLASFAEPGADALVFTTGAGTPISHASFQTAHYKPALRAAAVEARFHDLRHTRVALAIAAGAHPKAIQVRMGHSSITVTFDRYGHLFRELDEVIADAFNERWLAARAGAGLVA